MGRKAESVDIGLHQVAEGLVHHAVPLEGISAGEALRNDPHVEVPPAISSARVPDMQPAFVRDLELLWRESLLEARSDGGCSVVVHGGICRTGLV